jgi:hypothetical protein
LPVLWKSWGITHLVFEKDSNGYAKVRDKAIMELAEQAGVEVIGIHGRHLYDPEEVVKMNKGKGTMTLHQWQGVSVVHGLSRSLPGFLAFLAFPLQASLDDLLCPNFYAISLPLRYTTHLALLTRGIITQPGR